MAKRQSGTGDRKPTILSILKPYKALVSLLILLTLAGNGINLIIPKIISKGIDSFNGGHYIVNTISIEFITASLAIFFFSYLQSLVQTYVSEKVARDLRKKLSDKIAGPLFFHY